MNKTFTLIALISLQMVCFSQIITKKIKEIDTKKMTKSDAVDKMIMYEFTLNLISVSEATRNRIDNNDCKKTWGRIAVTFEELDENGNIIVGKRIHADQSEIILFNNPRKGVPHISNSYYQDRRGTTEDNNIGRVYVRIPERLVKSKRVVAVVSSLMQTAHKDNDFASFDHLETIRERVATFYIEDTISKDESMQIMTDGHYYFDTGQPVSGGNSDDNHRIWLNFTIKKK